MRGEVSIYNDLPLDILQAAVWAKQDASLYPQRDDLPFLAYSHRL